MLRVLAARRISPFFGSAASLDGWFERNNCFAGSDSCASTFSYMLA